MPHIVTNYFLMATASGTVHWNTDSIVATLHTSSATFNTDSENYDATNELATANGYTRLNKSLTNKTITLDDVLNQAVYDCDDITWTVSGGNVGPARYCALVDTQGGINKYLYIIDFETDQTANDTTEFKIVINANGLIRSLMA